MGVKPQVLVCVGGSTVHKLFYPTAPYSQTVLKQKLLQKSDPWYKIKWVNWGVDRLSNTNEQNTYIWLKLKALVKEHQHNKIFHFTSNLSEHSVVNVAVDSCSLVALTGSKHRFVLLAQMCVNLTTTESLCCTTIFTQCDTRGCLKSWECEYKSDGNDQLWWCCRGSFWKTARLKHTPHSHLTSKAFQINQPDIAPL